LSGLLAFLGGAVTAGFAIAGLFFLRFWRRTHDGLFLSFSIAFALLGIAQAMVSLSDMPVEERSPLFLLRLVAFGLIIFSILWKNRTTGRPPR
jgi:hypothetical protein